MDRKNSRTGRLIASFLVMLGLTAIPLILVSRWADVTTVLSRVAEYHPAITITILYSGSLAGAIMLFAVASRLWSIGIPLILLEEILFQAAQLRRRISVLLNRTDPMPVVEGQCWKLTFLKIMPGNWQEVIKRIDEHRESFQKVFYALGDADFVILSSVDTYPDHAVWTYLDLGDVVTDTQEMLCFRWQGAGEDPLSVADQYGALGISFLKLDPDFVHQCGVLGERVIAQYLNTQSDTDDVCCIPLSGLGWQEIILLTFSTNLENIMRHILSLRLHTFKDLTSQLPRGHALAPHLKELSNNSPLFSLTLTIPCVRRDIHGQLEIEGTIRPQTFVSCTVGAENRLIARLSEDERFTIRSVFGHRDLVLEPRDGEISPRVLLEQLQTLAEESRHDILAFRTFLSFPSAPTQKELGLSETRRSRVDALGRQVEALKQFHQAYESLLNNPLLHEADELAQIVLAYNMAISNPLLQDALYDLAGFMDETVEVLKEAAARGRKSPRVDAETQKLYNELRTIADLFAFSFRQRMSGLQVNTPSLEGMALGPQRARTQRLLAAANAVPRFLLSEIALQPPIVWRGCSVFGYAPLPSRLNNGVMSLPYRYLVDPSKWWQLSHETGHEYSAFIDLPKQVSIQRIVMEYAHQLDQTVDEESFLATTELIDEIFANVFEFEFGFLRQWDLYSRTVWQFLNDLLEGEESQERIIGYLLRSLFVLVYHVENTLRLDPSEPLDALRRSQEEITVLELDDELLDRIRARFLAAAGDSGIVEGLIELFLRDTVQVYAPKLRIRQYRGLVSTLAQRYRALESLRGELHMRIRSTHRYRTHVGFNHRSRQIASHLRRGHVLVDKQYTPVEILIALHTDDEPSADNWSTRIATILSLWHWEKTTHSERAR